MSGDGSRIAIADATESSVRTYENFRGEWMAYGPTLTELLGARSISLTFGSEFICLRIATEKIKSLRYKLRMMGVPLDGPANVFVDNESVVKSATRPESQLKKKHLSICYHAVRETIAAGIARIGWVKSECNLSDILTKLLPGPLLRSLVKKFLY